MNGAIKSKSPTIRRISTCYSPSSRAPPIAMHPTGGKSTNCTLTIINVFQLQCVRPRNSPTLHLQITPQLLSKQTYSNGISHCEGPLALHTVKVSTMAGLPFHLPIPFARPTFALLPQMVVLRPTAKFVSA